MSDRDRISFGVQDFDPPVQWAVHRVQPFESVRELMKGARALDFQSIEREHRARCRGSHGSLVAGGRLAAGR